MFSWFFRLMPAALAGGLLLTAGPARADLQITPIAEGLAFPSALAFLPDGAVLISEKPGALRIVRDGALQPAPVTGVPDVVFASQAGLLNVAAHPDFAVNGLVYLTYVHGDRASNTLRIAQGRLEAGALTDLEVVWDSQPRARSVNHYGGRIAFLPDGTFVMGTGDGYRYREEAQDLMSDLGKVIRLNADGSVPEDNPFVGRDDALPEIYSYGHRNPQGLLYDPASGRIYAHEHGPKGGDEINVIEAGANYGWPIATYGIDYNGAIISPYTEYEGTEQPIHVWTPSIAPAGFALYDGSLFPEWQGDLFVAALAARKLQRIDMESGAVAGEEDLLTDRRARLRDVRMGPDGALYVLTDSRQGALWRLTPGP